MNASSVRVLLVDDDPDLADLAATYLTQTEDRLTIDTAPGVDDALAQLSHTEYQCIVSDYEMPGQDGLAFLRQVRDTHPELPFILFTGRGSEAVASEAISAGVTDYLQKDTGTEQYELLANRITNAVDQRHAEKRARREQRRFETLFTQLSQPTVEVEYEGDEPIIQRVNEAFEETFGYDADALVGRSLDSYVVPPDRTAEATAINEHVRDGGSIEAREVTRETADGQREFLLQNAVYEDGSGGFAIYTDITARTERREELTRSQELLRHTERLANVGGWEADVASEQMQWTAGTYEILEKPAESSVTPTIQESLDYYHPADRPVIETAVRNCQNNGEPFTCELRVQTETGDERWVTARGEPVYEGDEVVAMRGAIHDVTADKERQQRLTRSEHLLRYAPEQLLVINEEMTVTYQSPPSPQCEWAQREFTDNNPLEHMHPDDRSRVAAQLNTVMRQPSTVSTVEFRVQDADDDWRWVESRLQNVADTDVIDGILAAMRDVSARKCQEQQLTQYTSFFEQLQATIQTLLQSTDAASAAAHAIESFESILEFDVAGIWLSTDDQRALEPVATSARGSDLVPDPPTYTPDTSSLSWTAYQNQELEYVSNVHERDDRAAEDTPIRSEVIVPLGRHGLVNIGSTEPDAFSAVEIDLLSVWCDTLTLVFARIAQLQVLQKRETALADERDRLKEFTATVSHDLRNPLNVAMGRAELAADECESSHLETVIRALDRMNDLIDDSLSLARQGTVVRDMGVVDLEQMVTECWQNANVDTATFVVEETAAIYADADRVPQVFENLFHNAVVHGGETVTVRVGCTTDGFYIADDGTGVTSEVKDRLFETGYTTRDEGRGYGLAIVERICEAHGWNIRVSESNAGGARFDVTGVEFP